MQLVTEAFFFSLSTQTNVLSHALTTQDRKKSLFARPHTVSVLDPFGDSRKLMEYLVSVDCALFSEEWPKEAALKLGAPLLVALLAAAKVCKKLEGVRG